MDGEGEKTKGEKKKTGVEERKSKNLPLEV